MKSYVVRRLLHLIPVVLGITFLVFLMLHLIPGDPVKVMLGERANAKELEAMRVQLGLDRPLAVQFGSYLVNLAQGDLGRSIIRNSRVTEELARTFPATIELALAAILIAVVVGVTLGAVAAIRRNSWWDSLCSALSLTGVSIPIFWLGLLLLLIFPANLGWFYFSGRSETMLTPHTGFYLIDWIYTGDLRVLGDVLGHLVLPAVTLSTVPMAMIARMTRSALLEVLAQDYIRTARAKGLSPSEVLWKHAFPNALIPVVTVVGLQFGSLLGGAVLTESVFQWPGLGTLVVEAVRSRDYPLVQGAILLIATTFCLVNLAVDLAYAWLDPRVSRQ